jgi:DNA-binding transcriptional MocR family regulator
VAGRTILNFENIRLDKEADQPLYRQLAEQLKAAIERGDLREGQKLPPIRAWKDQLGVSPVTATQAYEVLGEEGFASGQVGRGTYVKMPTTAPRQVREPSGPYPAPKADLTTAEPLAELTTYFKANRSSRVQRYLQVALARYQASPTAPAELIIMTSGSPAAEAFSLRRWRAAMAKAGESIEADSEQDGGQNLHLQYGSSLGDDATRAWLSEYLTRFGLHCHRDEILLTSGSQQGLDLIARVFTGPGELILVENPTYFSALEIFEQRGVNWLPVSLDAGGLQIETLERLAERYHPKLLYTIPTAQSPTGLTLAAERRPRLLELARRYNFVILEDDTCNEFYYQGDTPPPALKSYDRDGRVIYCKSFSKLIFPMVRFGTIVAQGALFERLVEAKATFDRSISLPLARSVLKFAAHPAFERELQQASALYRDRRDALLEGLERDLHGTGCTWHRAEGGFSMVVNLPRGLRAEELHLEAAERGLVVLPGVVFHPVLADAPDNTVRLSFGDNPPARLQEATRRLGTAVRALQSRRPTPGPGFMAAV